MSPARPEPPAVSGRLLTRHDAEQPEALLLMLHGGTANSVDPVDERSASWRRSRWMMSQIQGRAARRNVSTWLLRYQTRGWGGSGATGSSVADARWALDEVRRELGDLPVVLLGHSMGGRTAVAVADQASVTGVVALAPWLPRGESIRPLTGKHFAAAHGRSDRITSARQTREFVERARTVAAAADFTDMGRVGHYMFRRIGRWNDFALDTSLAFVDAGSPSHL